jgi:16S rRNA (guanine966-N2)-methyltransferase
MRIISGIFKGKKIFEPKDASTRPLKDLTKESIFNIIVHSNKLKIDIKNSFVLDLFSGVGSFGIECISRGAKHVTFFENYNGVLPILKKNLSSLKIDEKYQVIEQNILNGINLKNSINTFDIIFLDPPYKEKNLKKILDNISSEKLMKDNGVIIIHRHKNEKDQLSENLKIIEEKKYGISKIIFGILN